MRTCFKEQIKQFIIIANLDKCLNVETGKSNHQGLCIGVSNKVKLSILRINIMVKFTRSLLLVRLSKVMKCYQCIRHLLQLSSSIFIADYRYTMPSWTPDHSMILSLLLDTVVGTQKMVEIRKDYCRIDESLLSTSCGVNTYFTGSKSEGLDLPGSDFDYMFDMNHLLDIKVLQSLNDDPEVFPYSTFFVSTESVMPGFALLQLVNQTRMNPFLPSQYMYGVQYLSSDSFMQINQLLFSSFTIEQTVKRQGPSVEFWSPFFGKSESGIDQVLSIHCAFWPCTASEWVQRPRHFGWPSSQDLSSIVDFGFHLVAIGHPLSDTKLIEWRISFSLAERTLVWSFNHVQIQCYAVMKIILKEFIKMKCNPQNQVLCSYFIKSFLFWKYESTELNFWRADNFKECIMFLLTEFSKCVREGVLRHYFFPSFNLLSVKLTPAAQAELLQLFDIIIQSDIGILKECRTLRGIWSEFIVQVPENRNNLISNLERQNLLRNDECAMDMMHDLQGSIHFICITQSGELFNNVIRQISALSCKTHLKNLTIRNCQWEMHRRSLNHTCAPGNKGMYKLYRLAQNDTYSIDVSACKLWCAILLYLKGFNLSALDTVNQFLSSIPPYLIYFSGRINRARDEAKTSYLEMFLDLDITTTQRAKRAWMFDFVVAQDMTEVVPLAIQIEFYFSGSYTMNISPFTCAYYLQFLCYHNIYQHDNKELALQQLIKVAYNTEQRGNYVHHCLNIAGHCLLLAGRRAQARDMFYMSYEISRRNPPLDRYNSALWYLQNCL